MMKQIKNDIKVLCKEALQKEIERQIILSITGGESTSIRELQDVWKDSTPPTEQEVCEALSEYFKKDVKFSKETKEFYYWEDEYMTVFITETYGDGRYNLGVYLPPHLITLIGRFYEAQQ